MRFYYLKWKEDTKRDQLAHLVCGYAVSTLNSADRQTDGKCGGIFGVGGWRVQGTFTEDRLMLGLRVQRDSVWAVLTWVAVGWVPGYFGDSWSPL